MRTQLRRQAKQHIAQNTHFVSKSYFLLRMGITYIITSFWNFLTEFIYFCVTKFFQTSCHSCDLKNKRSRYLSRELVKCLREADSYCKTLSVSHPQGSFDVSKWHHFCRFDTGLYVELQRKLKACPASPIDVEFVECSAQNCS